MALSFEIASYSISIYNSGFWIFFKLSIVYCGSNKWCSRFLSETFLLVSWILSRSHIRWLHTIGSLHFFKEHCAHKKKSVSDMGNEYRKVASTKGQEISEWKCEVVTLPKIWTKKIIQGRIFKIFVHILGNAMTFILKFPDL